MHSFMPYWSSMLTLAEGRGRWGRAKAEQLWANICDCRSCSPPHSSFITCLCAQHMVREEREVSQIIFSPGKMMTWSFTAEENQRRATLPVLHSDPGICRNRDSISIYSKIILFCFKIDLHPGRQGSHEWEGKGPWSLYNQFLPLRLRA